MTNINVSYINQILKDEIALMRRTMRMLPIPAKSRLGLIAWLKMQLEKTSVADVITTLEHGWELINGALRRAEFQASEGKMLLDERVALERRRVEHWRKHQEAKSLRVALAHSKVVDYIRVSKLRKQGYMTWADLDRVLTNREAIAKTKAERETSQQLFREQQQMQGLWRQLTAHAEEVSFEQWERKLLQQDKRAYAIVALVHEYGQRGIWVGQEHNCPKWHKRLRRTARPDKYDV